MLNLEVMWIRSPGAEDPDWNRLGGDLHLLFSSSCERQQNVDSVCPWVGYAMTLFDGCPCRFHGVLGWLGLVACSGQSKVERTGAALSQRYFSKSRGSSGSKIQRSVREWERSKGKGVIT